MSRTARNVSLALVTTFASSVLVLSQVTSPLTDAAAQDQTGSSSVAFVYVSSSVGENQYAINAFSASSNGQLTPVSGSPFYANVSAMTANQTHLFGTNGIEIDSFSIAADGALTPVASVNAQKLNQGDCGGPESLFLDRTGETLYDPDYLGNICANNAYQSFAIDPTTGALSFLASALASPAFNTPLSFIGNNLYGYSSDCFHNSATVFGYMRNSDDTLTQLAISPRIPAAPSGDFYCAFLAAADPANHVVVPYTPLNYSFQQIGPPQLAVYTADSSGNLTTTSTASNMPGTAVTSVTDLQISPSGKILAVAGTTGLQLFHFNGASPITHFTGQLTTHQIDHIAWDNANHLYAISNSAGKLFVLTVTPTSVSLAPGSPYAITSPQDLVALPKP